MQYSTQIKPGCLRETQGKVVIGTATVLSGKTKTSVKLLPTEDNVLKGTGEFGLATDMKVVVSISLPGQAAEQARFTPLQKTKPEGK